MHLTIVWLSKGEILLKSGDDSLRALESGFGQSIRDHAVHSNRPEC